MTRINLAKAGTFTLGNRMVKRIGYGAMQLAGPGVFGPPKERDGALAVLREAVELGVDHIDTSDFYGPHVTNQLIREALHPYRDDLTIVTKIGAFRDAKGGWIPATSAAELTQAVHDNLRNLGLDVLDVVNLRSMLDVHGPKEGSLEQPLTALAELQRQGLVRHIGLSNVTRQQVADGRRICPIVCVQNLYNLAHREDEALVAELATQGTAYVPFFPLGGFTPLQSTTLSDVAGRLGATPMQVALAWLLQRSPNLLLIPGTSSVAHLRENLAAVDLTLSAEVVAELDGFTQAGALSCAADTGSRHCLESRRALHRSVRQPRDSRRCQTPPDATLLADKDSPPTARQPARQRAAPPMSAQKKVHRRIAGIGSTQPRPRCQPGRRSLQRRHPARSRSIRPDQVVAIRPLRRRRLLTSRRSLSLTQSLGGGGSCDCAQDDSGRDVPRRGTACPTTHPRFQRLPSKSAKNQKKGSSPNCGDVIQDDEARAGMVVPIASAIALQIFLHKPHRPGPRGLNRRLPPPLRHHEAMRCALQASPNSM